MPRKRMQSANSPKTVLVRPFSRQNERGALWLRNAKTGVSYLSGYISLNGQRQRLVLFCNQNEIRGAKDNQPLWRVFLP